MGVQAAEEPLSIADAMNALIDMDEPEDSAPEAAPAAKPAKAQAEPDAEEQEIEPEVEATGDDDVEEGSETTTQDDGTAEKAEEEPETVIQPPRFLDPKSREEFSKLPREAQEILARHDSALTADYTRKTQELAQGRKLLSQRLEALGEVISPREQRLKEWSEVDWVTYRGQVDSQRYDQDRAQMEREFKEFEELTQQRSKIEADNLAEHDAMQVARMREIAPELLDPKTGNQRRAAALNYALQQGEDREALRYVTASQLVMIDKARMWDDYQASRKAQGAKNKLTLVPKADAKSTGRSIKPAPRASSSPQTNAAKSFAKNPSMANAMRALADFDD